jgi:hypothetical protein
MTPSTDPLIQTLSNKWPPHAGFFSTWASVGYALMYPTCYLKNEKLTADQKRKLKPELEAAMAVFNTQPAKNLYQEITYCYRLDNILKKIYEVNPSLDKKRFEKISSQLEQCSIAAFEECEHEYGGIPLLGRFAKAYVDVNTKSEWSQHVWWISALYKCVLADKAIIEVSHDNRRRFELLVRSFKVLGLELCSDPSLAITMEQLDKNDESSKQAAAMSDRITCIACRNLQNRPSMQEGLKIFDTLAGFTLIDIEFCND